MYKVKPTTRSRCAIFEYQKLGGEWTSLTRGSPPPLVTYRQATRPGGKRRDMYELYLGKIPYRKSLVPLCSTDVRTKNTFLDKMSRDTIGNDVFVGGQFKDGRVLKVDFYALCYVSYVKSAYLFFYLWLTHLIAHMHLFSQGLWPYGQPAFPLLRTSKRAISNS